MRVLSLGAGVQSSTLLLMAVQGELTIDAAIFADTGWEPPAVYDWLTVLEVEAKRVGLCIQRVNDGDLRSESLSRKGRLATMPLHVVNPNGTHGMLRRQCTRDYKVRPIQRACRALGISKRNPGELLLGISLDEAHRMRESQVAYLRNVYPLIDLRMTRHDCTNWLARHGYSTPPKSACIGCPFRDDRGWRKMHDEQPNDWADAVDFDARVRQLKGVRGLVFLHRSGKPLDQVDLSTPQDHGQLDLFGEECFGVCGV